MSDPEVGGQLRWDLYGTAQASTLVYLFHGILGNRGNWRSFARALVKARPDLRIAAIDLRNHGDSRGFSGPHDLSACAHDLAGLVPDLGQPQGLIGHSFGGKVVLEAVRQQLFPELRTVVTLDTPPGASPQDVGDDPEVLSVIRALSGVPLPLPNRTGLIPLLEAQGLPLGIARWMTTNLRETTEGWTWRFELEHIPAMIQSYFDADYLELLGEPRTDLEFHLVRAAQSDRWPPSLLSRLNNLPAGAPTQVHVLENAGHWVHADNPDGLLRILDTIL